MSWTRPFRPTRNGLQSYLFLADKPEDVKDSLWTNVLYWLPPDPLRQCPTRPGNAQGRSYDERVRSQAEWAAEAALKEVKKPSVLAEPYELVLEVARDGSVLKIWAEPKNDATQALVKAFTSYQFDMPTVAPFYFHLKKASQRPSRSPSFIFRRIKPLAVTIRD